MLLKGDEILLIFLRRPQPGRVKTRLIPALGEEGAARLYRRMAEQVVATVTAIDRPALVAIACVEPPDEVDQVRSWLGPKLHYLGQVDGDLGERLSSAFEQAFSLGAERVVTIGTDCVELTAELVGEAFDALEEHDAVVGPARDGGYYLLGLSGPLPQVFRDVPWSSDRTAAVTLERLREVGASVHRLPVLRDIDTWDDVCAAGLASAS